MEEYLSINIWTTPRVSAGLASLADLMLLLFCWCSVRCKTPCVQLEFFCSVATCGTTVLWGTPWLFILFCSPRAWPFSRVQSAGAEKSLQPRLFPWGVELPGSLSPHLISLEVIKPAELGYGSVGVLVAHLCDYSYFTVHFQECVCHRACDPKGNRDNLFGKSLLLPVSSLLHSHSNVQPEVRCTISP